MTSCKRILRLPAIFHTLTLVFAFLIAVNGGDFSRKDFDTPVTLSPESMSGLQCFQCSTFDSSQYSCDLISASSQELSEDYSKITAILNNELENLTEEDILGLNEELDEFDPDLEDLDELHLPSGSALTKNVPEFKSELKQIFNALFNPASTPFSNPCQAMTHRVAQLLSSENQFIPLYLNFDHASSVYEILKSHISTIQFQRREGLASVFVELELKDYSEERLSFLLPDLEFQELAGTSFYRADL